jgi:transaldolase/glucose-6-phosphate isomerase
MTAEAPQGAEDRLVLDLGDYRERVDARLQRWEADRWLERLWDRDHTLWSPEPLPELADRLGWLLLPEKMPGIVEQLQEFAKEVREDGIEHVVVLGMGGSSLAPEMFQNIFGKREGHPGLMLLDSTHPSAVLAVQRRTEPARSLFIVPSKSGTTTETLSFFRYFWRRVGDAGGRPGRNFIAITDPGTPLAKLAGERGFRRVFEGVPEVGGRYSALSVFGLVPAALVGVDIGKLLEKAGESARSNAPGRPARESPGLVLGAVLGELALAGRDKLTLIAPPSLGNFPVWLEQLIAESTGKEGRGIVPVIDEAPAPVKSYGADRLFVNVQEGAGNQKLLRFADALARAGHPVVRITLDEKIDIGRELFNWEVATAAAGAVLGINPFDQPDVQMAKDLAKKAMQKRKHENAADEAGETFAIDDEKALRTALAGWMAKAGPKDYIAVLAFLAPTEETADALGKLRAGLQEGLRLPTTLGFGPRFLHSTGQLHKGGPNTGLFLQLVDEPGEDDAVPETDYTFGELIRAQALGDLAALRQRGRRVLRVKLEREPSRTISKLMELMREPMGNGSLPGPVQRAR